MNKVDLLLRRHRSADLGDYDTIHETFEMAEGDDLVIAVARYMVYELPGSNWSIISYEERS